MKLSFFHTGGTRLPLRSTANSRDEAEIIISQHKLHDLSENQLVIYTDLNLGLELEVEHSALVVELAARTAIVASTEVAQVVAELLVCQAGQNPFIVEIEDLKQLQSAVDEYRALLSQQARAQAALGEVFGSDAAQEITYHGLLGAMGNPDGLQSTSTV